MSVSVHGKVVLGFRATREDFMAKVEVQPTCQNGHLQKKGSEPFCAKDGTKFEARNNERATKALRELYRVVGMTFDEDTDPYVEMTQDGESSPFQFISEDYRSSFLVVGERLAYLSEYYHKLAVAFKDSEMKEARHRVEAIRKALGMTDRPIELFFEVNMS